MVMARAFDSIKQGLNEAIAHAQFQGKEVAGIEVHQPQAVDVSRLRERLSLTREGYAIGNEATTHPAVPRWCCST